MTRIIQAIIIGASMSAAGHQIHEAASNGDVAYVQFLLQRGTDVNILSESGATPLHHACETGKTAVVKLLLEKNADCNAVHNATSLTALHYAAGYANNDEIISSLIKAGADPNCVDRNSHTPLHLAASARHKKAYDALVKGGAKEDIVNKYGRIPAEYLTNS